MKGTDVMPTSHKKHKALIAGLMALGIALAGCTSMSDDGAVTFTDPWIKATDTQMTALFADVSNAGRQDVSIVGAQTEVASTVEIHEVVDGIMREKSGGVVIPAGESATLMPGGDHIMLMGLSSELIAGDRLEVIVTLSDGTEVLVDAEIRAFAAGEEEYDPGHGDMDMDHSHDGTMDE